MSFKTNEYQTLKIVYSPKLYWPSKLMVDWLVYTEHTEVRFLSGPYFVKW